MERRRTVPAAAKAPAAIPEDPPGVANFSSTSTWSPVAAAFRAAAAPAPPSPTTITSATPSHEDGTGIGPATLGTAAAAPCFATTAESGDGPTAAPANFGVSRAPAPSAAAPAAAVPTNCLLDTFLSVIFSSVISNLCRPRVHIIVKRDVTFAPKLTSLAHNRQLRLGLPVCGSLD